MTHHIDVGTRSRRQSETAQFISPHFEDIEQQSSYQGEEGDCSDGSANHQPIVCRDATVC